MISKETFLVALEEVDNAILASLPEPEDCSFPFSERFEQKMRSVIRRGNHPGIYKTFQRVACVLLVLLMLFSSVMIFSTDARAAIIGWIKEQYDTVYQYFFPSKTTSIEPMNYALRWIPDSYTLVKTHRTDYRSTAIYFDPSGKMIQFSYIYGNTHISDFVYGENYTCHSVLINGTSGDVYIADDPNDTNGILWVDTHNNVLLSISAPLDEVDLIKLAENVQIIE